MTPDETGGPPAALPPDTLIELRNEVASLRTEIEERESKRITLPELHSRIQRSVEQAIRSQVTEVPRAPEVRVEVTSRSDDPAIVVLSRFRIALYSLAGLGLTTVVGGSFVGDLTNTTIVLGLLASGMAGLAGLLLELVEKFS